MLCFFFLVSFDVDVALGVDVIVCVLIDVFCGLMLLIVVFVGSVVSVVVGSCCCCFDCC